jgi:putative membrane protein
MEFSHKKIAIALFALGLASSAFGQSSGFGPPPTRAAEVKAAAALQPADRKFMEEAAQDGMAEVALGKLAQSKASNAGVKQFAARIVQDHTKANEELKALASTRGVVLPLSLDKKHQKDVDELGKKSGTRFDHEYMELMVSDHKKDIAEFRKQSQSAKDPDLKNFVTKTLPTLEEHLKLAESTKAALK